MAALLDEQQAAAIVPTMPIGTLNQNTVCQPKLGQPAAEDRAEDQAGPDDHGVDPERPAELAARERVGHQGRRVGHQERAADALDQRGPTMRSTALGARAHATEAIVKSANPAV